MICGEKYIVVFPIVKSELGFLKTCFSISSPGIQQQLGSAAESGGGYQRPGLRLHRQQRGSLQADPPEAGGHQYSVREKE